MLNRMTWIVAIALLSLHSACSNPGSGDDQETRNRPLPSTVEEAVLTRDGRNFAALLSRERLSKQTLSAHLGTCATNERMDMVVALLEHGADPAVKNEHGGPPLFPALYPANHLRFPSEADAKRYLDIIRLFCEHGAPLDQALPYAAMLTAGVLQDDTASKRDKQTMSRMFEMLLERGAPVNQVAYGQTALGRAVERGALTLTKRLLDAGADVNLASSKGTPLAIAVAKKHAEIERLLRSAGAK